MSGRNTAHFFIITIYLYRIFVGGKFMDKKLLREAFIEALKEMKKADSSVQAGEDVLSSNSERSVKQITSEIQARQKLLGVMQETLTNTKNMAVRQQLMNDIAKEQELLAKDLLAIKKKLLEQALREGKINYEEYLLKKKMLEQEEKSIKLKKQLKEQTKEVADSTKKAALEFFGLNEALQLITPAGMFKMSGELVRLNSELAKTGIIIDDAYAPFTDFFRQSSKSLGIFVGQAREANGEIVALTSYGVGFKELNTAMAGLRDSMAGFSDMSPQTQQFLAGNASKMEKLGVSLEQQGKTWNFLNKSLRMSGIEAGIVTDKIARAGQGAGISAKKMLGDFSQIGPQLAAQGKKAVDIFIDLSKQAKALGVEVSTLMNTFGPALDTFEGVAQAAGKFNAVMGGDYLNSMELLNATESERVEIVKRSLDATGKNFDSLSKYEKIAVANALGIKDLNEAQQILGVSSIEMQIKKREEAATQEKLNKLQQQAVDIGARLASVFQVIYGAVLPFVKIIEIVVTKMLEFNDRNKGIPGIIAVGLLMAKVIMSFVIPAIIRIGTSMKTSLFGVKGAGGGMMSTFGRIGRAARAGFRIAEKEALKASGGVRTAGTIMKSTFGGISVAAKSLGRSLSGITFGGLIGGLLSIIPLIIMLWEAFHDFDVEHSRSVNDITNIVLPAGINATGNAAASNAGRIAALGVAAAGIGVAIFGAAYGVSKLVEAFKGFSATEILAITAALYVFGNMLVAIVGEFAALATTGVAEIGVGMIIGIGFAFLEVGAAVALAAWGMSLFVESLAKLITQDGVVTTLFGVAGALVAISGAIGVLMAAMAGAAIASFFGMSGVSTLTDAIKDLGKAFETFPSEKSISFKTSVGSVSELLKAAKELKSEDLSPSIELMSKAKEYLLVSSTAKAEDPAVNLLNKILQIIQGQVNRPSGGATSTSSQNAVYTLEIKGEVFGQLVEKYSPKSKQKTIDVMDT